MPVFIFCRIAKIFCLREDLFNMEVASSFEGEFRSGFRRRLGCRFCSTIREIIRETLFFPLLSIVALLLSSTELLLCLMELLLSFMELLLDSTEMLLSFTVRPCRLAKKRTSAHVITANSVDTVG